MIQTTWQRTRASPRTKHTCCAMASSRTIKLHRQEIRFHALASIDMVTNYPEIVHLNNETLLHLAQQFENLWLAQYPRLM
jgi:hypothetical protein